MTIYSRSLLPGFLNALERYSRQLPIIGVRGQERLAKSSVAVVGCGGVGTLVAELLARAGVGRLILVDYDVVALDNLNRGTLLAEEDVGKPKALVCAEHIHRINSQV
ncbi:MAG TPA: HesA/MoeB/ThiF family protein, partial [Pyrodictium sp.]|nr:HesA/MoeB/ThiF family protein [Pyrodictium sp.]